MRYKLFEAISRLWTRFSWPGIAMMLLLQRSPVPRMVADLQFSVGPRMVHIFKWIIGATVTSSLYQTVTGATGDLSVKPSPGAVVGFVNESMSIAIQAEDAYIVSVLLEGDLPPGVTSNIGSGGVVTNGVVAFSGFPSQVGQYPMKISVLSWEENSTYAGDPIFINFSFSITLEGPDVTKDPESIVVAVGTTAELSVEVANAEGTTFQWQRNVGTSLNDFADIQGATSSVYSVPNVMADSQGAYQVRVSKNGQTITTPFVFLTVKAANFGTWQIREFGTATSEESQPLENPDKDSFSNAFEFLFDLDPESPDSIQSPVVSYETIGAIDYVVFSFPALIDYPNLNFNFEATNDLGDSNSWTELVDGIDGTIIDLTSESTVLKMPVGDQLYCRIKIDTGG
ncbi:MAG: hypothetical protein O3C43_18590 [Verrucomicrobia bacterium]|nr:hypothetical protein [Verrucomicrobiota bacterium]